MLDPELRLAVYPFTRQADGDEIIVGRLDTGVFLALPSEAVDILDHLAAGKTIGQVEEIYRSQYGEDSGLEEFLTAMESRGFLQPLAVAGPTPQSEELRNLFLDASSPPGRRYHFTNFPQSLARLLFGDLNLQLPSCIGSSDCDPLRSPSRSGLERPLFPKASNFPCCSNYSLRNPDSVLA